MKTKFIFLLLTLGTFLSGQTKIWEKTFGGALEDRFVTSIETADNNFVFVGNTKSVDGDLTVNYGGFDIFITKIDANGNYIWKKTIGGSQDDLALNVITTNDGGVLLLSKSKSSNLSFPQNNGNFDLWLTKFDSAGNVVWNKSLGGSAEEISADIINFNDDFVVAVNTNSNDFDFANSNAVSKDVWLVKFSSTGNVLWKKQMQGSKDEDLVKLSNSSNNTFLTLINTKSTDNDFIKNTATDAYKGFLFQMDTDGNNVMNFMVESDNVQYPNYINNVKEIADSFVLAGKEDYKYQSGSTIYENFDANFIRISKTGNLTWKKHYNYATANADEAQFVDTTSDNQLIFFGSTGSGGITSYIWRAKLDMMGNQINLVNTAGIYTVLNVLKSANGNFILNLKYDRGFMETAGGISDILYFINSVGTSSSLLNIKDSLWSDIAHSTSHLMNDNTLISFWDELKPSSVSQTGYDVWITRTDVNAYLFTSNPVLLDNEIKIYPNPTSKVVNFSKTMNQVSLFDASGRFIRQEKNIDQLDISKLNTGVYYLKFLIGGKLKTKKVIKK